MPYLLRSSADGKIADARFESFARIGSSPACDLVIDRPDLPAHAATVVADGTGACRIVMKSPGLSVNGAPCDEASSVLLRTGESVRLNAVTITLLPDVPPIASPAVAVAEIPRTVLPGPSRAADAHATADAAGPASPPSSSARPSPASTGLQIAAIVLCLAAAAGMVGWMLVGDGGPPAAADSQPAPMTLPQIITLVEKQRDWPWTGISKDRLLADLRRAYRMESLGHRPEAREQLNEVRLALLADIPRDDRGHFETPAAPTGEKPPAAGPPAAALTERWFPEPDRRKLYDAVAAKYAEL